MPERRMRDSLEDLRARIEDLAPGDEVSRTLLAGIRADLDRVLAEADDEPCKERASLRNRLESAAGHFEASHPDFTAVLQRAADALAHMGI